MKNMNFLLLREQFDIVFLPADKANVTVIMNMITYKCEMKVFHLYPSYQHISFYPTNRLVKKTNVLKSMELADLELNYQCWCLLE